MTITQEDSLSKKALLVKFTMQLWSGRKQDKDVNNTVDRINDANGAGNFTKKLIDDPLFAKLGYIIRQAYIYHQTMTIPWMYKGAGLLPMKLYPEYTKRMREFREELEQAKREFESFLPMIIEKQKTDGRLGKLFNAADYPEFSELTNKFGIDIKITPVPEAGHFIVDAQNEELSKIKGQFEEFENATRKEASTDLWNRLYDVVNHMVAKLSDPTAKFKDTLVGNIADLCTILPSLNIMNDEKLDAMVRDVTSKLTSCDPDVLRTDKKERKEVAKSAKEILATMEGFMG